MKGRGAAGPYVLASQKKATRSHTSAFGVLSTDVEQEQVTSFEKGLEPLPGKDLTGQDKAHRAHVESIHNLRHRLGSKHGIPVAGLLDLNRDGKLNKKEAAEALRMAGDSNSDDIAAALRHPGAVTELERITAGTIMRLPCKDVPYLPNRPAVSIAAKILNISDIDCVNQCYCATFDLWVSWENPSLDLDNLKNEWLPAVYFHNAMAHTVFTRGARPVGDHSFTGKKIHPGARPGQWCYSIEVAANFREIMELRDFPFDWQELTIQVRMNNMLGACVMQELEWGDNGESVVFEPTLSIPEWTVCQPAVEIGYYPKFMFGRAEDNYDSALHIVLRVRRTWRFYCFNIGPFVLGMPLLAATPVFFSVNDGMEIRVGIDFTLVLTCVALKFLLHGNLPNVPYLTRLDKYVLASFGMICLMTCENGAISYLSIAKGEEYARDVDVLVWVGFGVGWCLFHLYVFISSWLLINKRNAETPPVVYLDHTDVTHGVKQERRYFEDAAKALMGNHDGRKTQLSTDDDHGSSGSKDGAKLTH
jgi:hypothetical protein